MARVLYIDDATRQLVVKTARDLLSLEGHEVQGATWDAKVFGKYPGTIKLRKPADFICRIKPEVLFIHFGSNVDVTVARQIVCTVLERCPDIKIVVITNVDPNETYGADYSLRLPYDPEDLLSMVD